MHRYVELLQMVFGFRQGSHGRKEFGSKLEVDNVVHRQRQEEFSYRDCRIAPVQHLQALGQPVSRVLHVVDGERRRCVNVDRCQRMGTPPTTLAAWAGASRNTVLRCSRCSFNRSPTQEMSMRTSRSWVNWLHEVHGSERPRPTGHVSSGSLFGLPRISCTATTPSGSCTLRRRAPEAAWSFCRCVGTAGNTARRPGKRTRMCLPGWGSD